MSNCNNFVAQMGNIQAKKLHTFLGHNDSLYTLEVYNDHQFFSAGSDGMVVRWNLQSPDEGEVVAKIDGSIYSMAYDQESNLLFVGHNNEGIHAIDLSTNKERNSVKLGNHQIFGVKSYKDLIWVALESGELVVLDKELQVLKRKKFSDARMRSLDFFDEELAVGFSDNKSRVISVDTLDVLYELESHKKSVFSAKYHPSGKYLVTGSRDAQLKIWDTSVDYVLRESIAAHLYTINEIAFHESGKFFVTCSMDKSIKLWNAHNFQLLKVLDKHRHAGHGNSVNKVLWMKYHDLLVSCSDDRTISVWEVNLEE